MDVKDRILAGAEELFFQFGVKSVTMDDVARHLFISKKTIYQYFRDKEDLVARVTQYNLEKQAEEIDSISATAADPIDEVLKTSEFMKVCIQKMNPSILFDIQKFHPKAWKIYLEHKEKSFLRSIVTNLKKGIEQGYYRKDLDVEILSMLRLEQIQIAFNPAIFPPAKFDLTRTQLQFIDHFLHGICTLKGHKVINKYKQINEED